MHYLGLLPVLLFIVAAFSAAFLPSVMPRMTNAYYSKIGMKTRVAEEDYRRLPTRIAGGILLVVGLFNAHKIWTSGHY
jgi:hypothetical protein